MQGLVTVGEKGVIQIFSKKSRPPIASGRKCKVYHGYYDKQEVAVKRIELEEGGKFEKEANELRSLKHLNIVHYYFFDYDWDFEYIVMEKCESSLQDYFKDPNGKLNDLKAMKDISSGLHYLHSNDRIHRNLHPSNILLSSTKSGGIVAKLADFGIMKHSPDESSVECSGQTGSLRFHNPEEMRKQKVSKKSDIFSLGLCFFAILTRNKNPYGNNEHEISYAIYKGYPCDLEAILTLHNGYATYLIGSMLSDLKEGRPNICQVLSHYLFWDADKKIDFFQRASDAVKSDTSLAGNLKELDPIGKGYWWETFFQNFDRGSAELFWQHFLDSPPRGQLPPSGPDGLLRQIRNWCHHFNELKPKQIQQLLGGDKQSMVKFMEKIYPRLLPKVYEMLQPRSTDTEFFRFYQFKTD